MLKYAPLTAIFGENCRRSFLALALMIGQSFFFNAVSFTYGLVIKKFFKISDKGLPLHLLPFTLGSFLGPITLGRLSDKVGRKPMIIATYGVAGSLLVAVCYPFAHGVLTANTLGICFTMIFFAASAAYLTVSEIFPLERRGHSLMRSARSWEGSAPRRCSVSHLLRVKGTCGTWLRFGRGAYARSREM